MKQDIFRPIDLTPNTSAYLDFIRSAAAMAVMFGHMRGLLFVDYEHLAPSLATIPVKALYFATGFGHQAVMVFFVLSGFLISSSVLRKLERSNWSWLEYSVDRGVRLYLVLLPGLLFGGLLDSIGLHFFNQSGIYTSPIKAFGDGIVAAQLNMSSFLGSLFFLQTRFTTVFGSNAPLWSLFNEFWYYVLFPALIWVILSAKRRSLMLAVYIGIAVLAVWVLGDALSGFMVWLAGGAVALTSRILRFPTSARWLVGMYLFVTMALMGGSLCAARIGAGWLGSDLAVGLTFALFTHGIVQLNMPLAAILLRIAKIFSGFSYSLYVLHFPVLLLVRAIWVPVHRLQPDDIHLVMGAGITCVVLMYAFAIANVTERRTHVVRLMVRSQFVYIYRITDLFRKLYRETLS